MSRTRTKKHKTKSQYSLSANKSNDTSPITVLFTQRKQSGTPFHALLRKGSFTLEAAVVVPVFAAFLVFIMFSFRILMTQQNLAEAMQKTARELSVAAFSEKYGISSSVVNVGSLAGAIVKVNSTYDRLSKGEGYRYTLLGRAGLNLTSSSVSGDYVTLNASYVMKFPLGLVGNRSFLMKQTVKARKWTGYHKKGQNSTEEDDIWVYITPYGRVYHRNRDCTYLRLSVQSVSRQSLESRRNRSGSRYTPCAICGNKNSGSSLVYITDYGTSYHTRADCSGLKRGIDMIRLKEAQQKGYGGCSKCG